MALNQIFPDDRKSRRARPVGNNVAPGTAIINGGKPAVTITGSRDYAGNAITATGNGLTIVLAGGKGGESLPADDYATISFTGTYGWPVAGATIDTEPGTPVYIEADGDLTLTEGTNEPYGVVEFYRGAESATDTAVTIGA
ncbi:hypothetical protein SEA_DEJAVU_38 [Microbacterium Phage DejaVu]|nr:hypothetical protein LUPINE_35 [Microbacterium phage Lupine]QDH92187.1 hypothetical protein SEA_PHILLYPHILLY_36 [Microbacterium phage PhillyPhilly]QDK03279.1 hypothetical protein SEA_ROMAN_37 [Microbacterium phage Roman]QIG58582.1 hypothetical protein SEA_HUBBS_37 [Microbacterium phage Hubbs]UVG34092.1 hypothetical protein SEA_PAVLO_35 [Microbacterium phage Pavlo]WNM66170.1 hypothetical protein SEA_DEJAVU_38 [Microbacterium Phage DejaVu]